MWKRSWKLHPNKFFEIRSTGQPTWSYVSLDFSKILLKRAHDQYRLLRHVTHLCSTRNKNFKSVFYFIRRVKTLPFQTIPHLAPGRWKSWQDYCLLKWLIGIRERVTSLLLMCVTQWFCRGNHLYNPNGLKTFFSYKGGLLTVTILEPQNGPNIGEFILSRIQAQICQFYNVPQERNQNIFLCYMTLVCILIQKGNNIVSIGITYKHIKTHK